jgi:hypothetical protein
MDGTVNSVTWSSDGKGKLSTRFISDDKSVIGIVKLLKDGPDIDNQEIPIFETGNLSKLLGTLGEQINIEVVTQGPKAIQLKLSDKDNTKVQFALADPGVIPTVPKMKYVPDNFEVCIKLTPDKVNTFIKAKSAMSKVMLVTINTRTEGKSLKAEMILGDSSDDGVNIDKVIIPVETTRIDSIKKMSFNADMIKSVLSANKESEAKFEISKEGLARMQFKTEFFETTYFFVAKTDN